MGSPNAYFKIIIISEELNLNFIVVRDYCNKIKEMRTSNIMAQNESEMSIKTHGNFLSITNFYIDFEHTGKNLEIYEDMKNMIESIKTSLKLQPSSNFIEVLKAVKKILSKRKLKEDKKRKTKN